MKKKAPCKNTLPQRHRAPAGFTLIEIMIVLLILLAIGAVAVNAYRGQMQAAYLKTTKLYVDQLASAIKRYELNVGRLPSELNDLLYCPDGVDEKKWAGPYLEDNAKTEDVWGNTYQYITPGRNSRAGFDVWSYGPDGTDGTDDDIGNWTKSE